MTSKSQITRQRAILSHYAKGTPVKMISHLFGVHFSYPGILARRSGVRRGKAPNSQAARVLHAVETGARTYADVGAALDIPNNVAAARLSELAHAGLLRASPTATRARVYERVSP